MTIGIDQMVHLVILFLVVGGICWLLWWLIGYCGIPEPFNKAARIVVAVFAVLFLLNILLGFVGHPIVQWR